MNPHLLDPLDMFTVLNHINFLCTTRFMSISFISNWFIQCSRKWGMFLIESFISSCTFVKLREWIIIILINFMTIKTSINVTPVIFDLYIYIYINISRFGDKWNFVFHLPNYVNLTRLSLRDFRISLKCICMTFGG